MAASPSHIGLEVAWLAPMTENLRGASNSGPAKFKWPSVGRVLVLTIVSALTFLGLRPNLAWGVELIRDPEVKRQVRARLQQEYQPRVDQASGNLYHFEVKPQTAQAAGDTKKGGTWTGGGGSGVACFNEGFAATKDEQEHLLPTAYDRMYMVTTLDLVESQSSPIHPALPGESAIGYIRRIISGNFARPLPLFSQRLLALAEVLDRELELQIAEYQRGGAGSSQPTLRDFGSPMIEKELSLPANCQIVQFATRLARVRLHQVDSFFIDYDVPLVLLLGKLAKDPAEGVIATATLILHEALYLMGSAIEHLDSSATAFRMIPLLLSQATAESLRNKTRAQGAQMLHDRMKSFGMKNYHFVALGSEPTELSAIPRRHLQAISQVTQSLEEAEKQFRKTYGRPSYYLRENQPYLRLLTKGLDDFTDEVGAFVALSSLVNFEGEFIIDDLFLETPDPGAVVKDFCRQIRRERLRLLGYHPERHFLRVYERALTYCE